MSVNVMHQSLYTQYALFTSTCIVYFNVLTVSYLVSLSVIWSTAGRFVAEYISKAERVQLNLRVLLLR